MGIRMSDTPIFDQECALHPEIDITAHEDVIEIWTSGEIRPLHRVTIDRLEFNYAEPYRGIAPYSHPSMPKGWA